jgi:hypothetical protein
VVAGNIGNIPLVIVGAICRDSSNPFGDPAECSSNGVAYLSFGQWVRFAVVSLLSDTVRLVDRFVLSLNFVHCVASCSLLCDQILASYIFTLLSMDLTCSWKFCTMVFQVGAVIVYTFVYQMLAPPEDSSLSNDIEGMKGEDFLKPLAGGEPDAGSYDYLEDVEDGGALPLIGVKRSHVC